MLQMPSKLERFCPIYGSWVITLVTSHLLSGIVPPSRMLTVPFQSFPDRPGCATLATGGAGAGKQPLLLTQYHKKLDNRSLMVRSDQISGEFLTSHGCLALQKRPWEREWQVKCMAVFVCIARMGTQSEVYLQVSKAEWLKSLSTHQRNWSTRVVLFFQVTHVGKNRISLVFSKWKNFVEVRLALWN